MNSLIEVFIALADLLEAEGRALRHATVRTALAVGCVGTLFMFMWVGFGFCAWAGYQYLLVRSDPIIAALVCGLLILFFSGVLTWQVKRLMR